MARDYAQRGARRSQTQQRKALPGWVLLVLGLSMGLAVAAFVYISRPAEPMPGAAAEAPPPAKKPAANGKAGLSLPPEEKETYSFYKELKKQKVYIPRDEKPRPPKPAPKAPTEDERFLIQIASYRSANEAENLRAQLALIGIEARIEKVSVNDAETYFRVRAGPLPRGQAEAMLARLDENQFDGMMLRAN